MTVHIVQRWIVGAVLGLWFAASVVHQFQPRYWRRWAARDVLGLLPRWSFFAPNPGRHDLHVVYRDRTDESWGSWVELGAAPAPRWWRAAWNPHRYARKAVMDLVNGVRAVPVDRSRSHLLSSSYVALLDWVMRQPSHGARYRQVAVLGRHDHDRRILDVLFVSDSHRLEPPTAARAEPQAPASAGPAGSPTGNRGEPARTGEGAWSPRRQRAGEPPRSTEEPHVGT
jgi:hypothetical protein